MIKNSIHIIILCFFTVACYDAVVVPVSEMDIQPDEYDYKAIGAGVSAKEYSAANYDCSNFSVQFYQEAFKNNLPCRVRLGRSGGNGFSSPGPHAWNSILLGDQWLDWEPQTNSIHNGHTKTSTSAGPGWGTFLEEDLIRMLYELVGRYVPSSVIDKYEVDSHLLKKSPFNFYFPAYCLSDDPDYITLVNRLKISAPNNGDGVITISADKLHIMFAYRYNGKYWGIDNLEEHDPAEGRYIKHNTLNHDFTASTEFITEFSIFKQAETLYFSANGGAGTSNLLVQGISFGLLADAHVLFGSNIAAGIKSSTNLSTDGITAMEAQAYFRYYFWKPIGLFAQSGVGFLALFKGEDVQNSRASPLFDVTAGVTVPLPHSWHIEPSIHTGYPFIAGFSLSAGYKFPLPYKTVSANEIIKRVIINSIDYIIFAPNRSQFNAELEPSTKSLNDLVLNKLAQTLKDNPGLKVRIEGHANPVTRTSGETEELYALSIERANEIFRLLRAKGVKEEQLVIIAHGGARIITNSPEDWSMNRRVELVVIQLDT